MARRLVNTTIKNQKDTFDFELWDMESSSVDLDYVVEFDANGFEIDWRGDGKDTPLVSSTLQWTMFLDETQRSAIMPVVFSDTEFRMCVRIKRAGNVFWCGVVHAEETSEEIGDGIITVSLQASDGLGMLSNIDWKKSNGDRYSGHTKAVDALWSALSKLPHSSLIASAGGAVLVEHNLNRPITQNASEVFLHGPISGVYRGVMDYMKLEPNTFYYSNLEEEKVVGGTEFGSVDKFNPDDFTNSKLVVKDIMASLGASICFADGKWQVWDKTVQFATAFDYQYSSFEWYVTQDNELDNEAGLVGTSSPTIYDRGALSYANVSSYNSRPRYDFLRGAALKAQHSVRGVTQKHTRAGSDLLYANGIGYHDNQARPDWEAGESLTQPLIELRRKDRSNGADTDSSPNNDYIGFFTAGTSTTYDGLLNTRGRERTINDIQIPNGNSEGSFRIHIAGNCEYTKREVNRTGPDISSYGTLGIYKQRVEIYDGTDYYRLSRPVRTIRYDSQGGNADVTISGSNGMTYSPKFWSLEYEWIKDDDARYDDAWLDIPMGANNNIVEEGSSSKFMQTDYPSISSASGIYTPPLTKLDGTSDNTLITDDTRAVYLWRHDYIYDMPSNSGTIEQITIKNPVLEEWQGTNGPNLTNASNGSTLDIGTSYLDPTYRTESYDNAGDGYGNKPNGISYFKLSGVEVMWGDGTQEFDQNTVAYPTTTKGREILNLNGTRLGASFVTKGGATHGRYTSSDFITPNVQQSELKFARAYDQTFKKESLSELVTANFLEMRGKVRQTVTATTIVGHDSDADSNNQIILPYNKLVTDTLDTTTKMIIPYSVSYSLTESKQRLEGWFRSVSAEANIGSTTEANDDSTRGPLPFRGNLEKPSGTDLSDFVQGEATSNTGSGVGGGGKFGDLFPMFIRRL